MSNTFTFMDQLNEKGNIQVMFKGVLYCHGQLVWPKNGGIYCENK